MSRVTLRADCQLAGTYNNQYMVVDYKLFSPGAELPPAVLYVSEQIPGLVVFGDITQELGAYLALLALLGLMKIGVAVMLLSCFWCVAVMVMLCCGDLQLCWVLVHSSRVLSTRCCHPLRSCCACRRARLLPQLQCAVFR